MLLMDGTLSKCNICLQDKKSNLYSILQRLTAVDSYNLKKSFSDGIFWTKIFLSTTLRQIFWPERPVPGKEGWYNIGNTDEFGFDA